MGNNNKHSKCENHDGNAGVMHTLQHIEQKLCDNKHILKDLIGNYDTLLDKHVDLYDIH